MRNRVKKLPFKCVWLSANLIAIICGLAQNPSEGGKAAGGAVKSNQSDLNAAIADLDRALRLKPNFPVAYAARGTLKVRKGDFDGAIADLTAAIKLNPKDTLARKSLASAYAGRCVLAQDKGDWGDALADSNRALQLDPSQGPAYTVRGLAKMQKYQFDEAIADFNLAIKNAPDLASPYAGRGDAKFFKGDLNGALADYSQAAKLNPKFAADACRVRADTNFLARNWAEALRDYQRFCQLQTRDQDYPRLFIWVIQSRLGNREAASRQLAAYFNTANLGWTRKIAAHLLGDVSEPELLSAASTPIGKNTVAGQRCEAFFFIGTKRLLAGDKAFAADYFKKCVGTQQVQFNEYQFAKAELKGLGY